LSRLSSTLLGQTVGFALVCVAMLIFGCRVTVAQVQSSVTLYGLVDIGFAYQTRQAGDDPSVFVNPGRTRSQFAMASGQQSGSRWGIKGVEDLGRGVRISFVYESGVAVNTGASSGFTRQATLGVSSDAWGDLAMGRRVSPSTEAFADIDPFEFSFGQASLTTSMGSTFIRLSNLVAYTSPTLNGVTAYGGWSFDTGLRNLNSPQTAGTFGTSNKFRALSLGLRYEAQRLLIAGTYDTYYSPAGRQASAVKQWNVGATYDLTTFKLHAAYGQNTDGLVNGPGALANLETTGGDTNTNGAVLYLPGARTNQWMIGLTAPVGAASHLLLSIQQQRPGGRFNTRYRSNQTAYSIGYTYRFSTRTNVYAFYSHLQAPDMFEQASAQDIGVGIRHKF